MKSTRSQANAGSGESEPILHTERSLIELEEYAAREGVSSSIIHECGRLGIVQIRKCKGRCYVVDVPLSPHISSLEGKAGNREATANGPTPMRLCDKIKEFTNPDEWATRQAALDNIVNDKVGPKLAHLKETKSQSLQLKEAGEVTNKRVLESKREVESSSSTTDTSVRAELRKVSRQKEKVPAKTEIDDDEILDMLGLEPPELINNSKSSTSYDDSMDTVDEYPIDLRGKGTADMMDDDTIDIDDDEPIRTPDLETPPEPENFDWPIERIEEMSALEESLLPEVEREGTETKSVLQSRRFWQVMTLFSLLLFVSAFCITVWIYNDYQVQKGRLNEAYASIQSVYNDFIEQKETTHMLQEQLDTAQSNLLKLQNELGQSSAEIKTLQAQLGRGEEVSDEAPVKNEPDEQAGQTNEAGENEM